MRDRRRGLLIRLGELAGIITSRGAARTAEGTEDGRELILADAIVDPEWETEKPARCALSFACDRFCPCYQTDYRPDPAPAPAPND